MRKKGRSLQSGLVSGVVGNDTLLVHCLTVLMSSWMTRSMHFTQGSFSLMICFFTMASNARSGVKRPVLKDIETRQTQRQGGQTERE